MNRIPRFTERISRVAARLAGGLLLLDAVLITVDVVLRKAFGISFSGSEEFSGYVLAISVSWGLSMVLLRRGHIRIDALYARLPQRVTVWMDLCALISLGVFMAFVTWFSTALWLASVETGSTSSTSAQTPLMIPQGLWLLGFGLFMLTSVVLLVRTLALLPRGDFFGIRKLIGIRTVDEEVSAEVPPEILRKTVPTPERSKC